MLPPDIRLGSWNGFRKLRDGIRKLGHKFVLHDNYVDYYKHTSAYKDDEGVLNMDDIKHESTEWLGGPQEWLCSTKALKYMRNNFDELDLLGGSPSAQANLQVPTILRIVGTPF